MWRSVWGKILGAFFGFSLAGPVGALFGIFVGNLFDKGLAYSRGVSPSALRGETRRIFNNITFSVMGHVAKADGRVSEEEIEAAREAMQTLRLNRTEQQEAIHSFANGKSTSFQLGVALTELKYACRQQPSVLRMFVEIQYKAVTALGFRVDIRKQQLLNSIFQQLGFMPIFQTYQHTRQHQYSQYSHYQQYQQQHRQQEYRQQNQNAYHTPYIDELAQAYKILEISERSTAAEIKKAYRKQMSKHHPDKLIAKGLSEKQVKQGTEHAQKIQAAYEKIRESRGF